MSEQLAKREKDLIYEQSPDSTIFNMVEEPIHDADVTIQFPVTGLKLESVFQAEALLRKAGVSFDTSYGSGCRDWEFDWSLHGAYVKSQNPVDKNERKRRWYQSKLAQSYPDEPGHLRCSALIKGHREIYIIVYGKEEDFGTTVDIKLAKLGAEIVRNDQKVMGYKNGGDFIRIAYTGDAC